MHNRPSPSQKRLELVREKLAAKNLDGFLISKQENRHYITGWQGDTESGFVLITPKKAVILTDSRYTEHVSKETKGFEVLEVGESSLVEVLQQFTREQALKRLGFESHDLSVFLFKRFKKFLKGVRLVAVTALIEELRSKKDEGEVEKLRKAAAITSQAFNHILSFVRKGVSEKEIAWELTTFMRAKGAQANAWESLIVAVGDHSSMAHYGGGSRKIKKNDLVLLDFGCVYQGYCSDMTRVIFVGQPSNKQKETYQKVLAAQKLGIKLIRARRLTAKIDEKVRSFLEKDSQFFYRHGLGHGVGLQVHELPVLSSRVRQKLAVGNVVTIEPGIYEPGWGGVRIEDMVLVTETGYEIITNAPKEIEAVTIS